MTNEPSEYWVIVAEEALGDADVTASHSQINKIASWIESAHDCYGEASGEQVFTSNFNAEQKSKIDALQRELHRERESVPCPECAGKKTTIIGGQITDARFDCWKCNQTGKVYL